MLIEYILRIVLARNSQKSHTQSLNIVCELAPCNIADDVRAWFDVHILDNIGARIEEYESTTSQWGITAIESLQIINFSHNNVQQPAAAAAAHIPNDDYLILAMLNMSLFELHTLASASPHMHAMARKVAASIIGNGKSLSENFRKHNRFEIEQILSRFGDLVPHMKLTGSMDATTELAIYEKYCRNIKSVELADLNIDCKAEHSLGRIMRSVVKLSARNCSVRAKSTLWLLLSHTLEELELENCDVTLLHELEFFHPSLKTFSLKMAPIPNTFCESLLSSFIDRHPHIRNLTLELYKDWDFFNGLNSVLRLANLKQLHLRAEFIAQPIIERNVTENSELTRMRHLESLSLNCNNAYIMPFLRATRSANTLEHLELYKTDIIGDFHVAIRRMTALRSLYLIDINLIISADYDSHIQRQQPQIQSGITHITIEGEFMPYVLEEIRIDALLNFIQNFHNLEKLTLINTCITLNADHMSLLEQRKQLRQQQQHLEIFAYDFIEPDTCRTISNMAATFTFIPMEYCPIRNPYSERIPPPPPSQYDDDGDSTQTETASEGGGNIDHNLSLMGVSVG